MEKDETVLLQWDIFETYGVAHYLRRGRKARWELVSEAWDNSQLLVAQTMNMKRIAIQAAINKANREIKQSLSVAGILKDVG